MASKDILKIFDNVQSEDNFTQILLEHLEDIREVVSPVVLAWIQTPPLATIETRRSTSFLVGEVIRSGVTPTTDNPTPLGKTDIRLLNAYRVAIARDESKREESGGHLLPIELDRVGIYQSD